LRRDRRWIVGLLFAWGAWACHDAPGPWEPDGEPVPEGPRQLTFSSGDDRSPTWSLGGDSILYVAEGYGDLARSDGVLVSIHRKGGTVAPALPLLQPPRAAAPAVLAPALEPATGRIAYAQTLLSQVLCVADVVVCDGLEHLPPPSLQTGRIRVRAPDAILSADQDPTLPIRFDGVEFDTSDPPEGVTGVWVTRLHPFQRRYNDIHRLPVHPSWDPRGGRLVWSDGLQLLLWTPGENEAVPIPGTANAISPAWSPDGEVIAFARQERGEESSGTCEHFRIGKTGELLLSCVEARTQWPIARTVVSVIPVAGGEPVDLFEGTDPAWSPDGRWIYVARTDRIWRVAATGGVFEPIEGTEGGTEPAVSPDGKELAFTRLTEAGKGDIWVVPLP
jgi:hypothetical protein